MTAERLRCFRLRWIKGTLSWDRIQSDKNGLIWVWIGAPLLVFELLDWASDELSFLPFHASEKLYLLKFSAKLFCALFCFLLACWRNFWSLGPYFPGPILFPTFVKAYWRAVENWRHFGEALEYVLPTQRIYWSGQQISQIDFCVH